MSDAQEKAPARHFARYLSNDSCGLDDIDRELDEMIVVDPYNGNPPNKRSDKEFARLLTILDSIDERRNKGER